MIIKWFECRRCHWQGWLYENEHTPDDDAWGGCGEDASTPGPHNWKFIGKWHCDEEPDNDQYIG